MNRREAAVVAAYTGYLIGEFSDMQAYIEEKFERPVFTHEMADEKFRETCKALCKDDFIEIHENLTEQTP